MQVAALNVFSLEQTLLQREILLSEKQYITNQIFWRGFCEKYPTTKCKRKKKNNNLRWKLMLLKYEDYSYK